MIEQIGAPGFETISRPNGNAGRIIQALLAAGTTAPVIAEIGVGIGATTLAMATLLANRGELHLYDFQAKIDELVCDLAAIGFTNIRGYGNTERHWDSYNWALARALLADEQAIYDYIYLDGAHTFAVDALACVLCDRLLKPGGYLEFDDYNWRFADSHWMEADRMQFMTDEQINTPQVKMVVDLFLRENPDYVEMQPGRLYRKRGTSDAVRETVTWRGHRFEVVPHPAVAAALREFTSEFEAGTLAFFDAVLPACDRMIDVGAHVGLMSLYAACRVAEVYAFEPSPTNFARLSANVAVNDELRARIRLFNCGLSNRNERIPLFAKCEGDSGSSIFRTVERAGIIDGAADAIVEMRHAEEALRSVGISNRTLLKIDIEGAEYRVVPAIAGLLAETKPYLHLSFHPFNLVAGSDDYLSALLRIQNAVEIAAALAGYRFMYFYEQARWQRVDRSEGMIFLREYLLRPKHVARIASPQYGFVDAVGFTDVPLEALDASGAASPLEC